MSLLERELNHDRMKLAKNCRVPKDVEHIRRILKTEAEAIGLKERSPGGLDS